MSAGEDIRIDVRVSRRLLSGIPAVVEMNRRWHPRWHPTRGVAEAEDRPRVPGLEVAASIPGAGDRFARILRAPPERPCVRTCRPAHIVLGTAVALPELAAIARCAPLTRVHPVTVGRTRLSASWLSEFKYLHE